MDVKKYLAGFAALALLLPAAVTAAPAAGSGIGMVDIEQVITGYNKKKQADDAVKATAKKLEEKLELRNTHKLLTEAEVTELDTLTAKAKPTDKEKARRAELQDLDKARDDELHELQNKKNPSDADRKRLQELLAIKRTSEENLMKLSKEYRAQVMKESAEKGKTLTDDILNAVKAIAEKKGLTAVFDKKALLYGGEDITTAVLDMLNKK